ncbi:MAG: C45 family autoproteolytic acyltransferase/hydrolase [Lentisphaerae bacterium]|nr:C45 family autoproteolytic acyltransferase/hydrolase [Lentisphaerota bacterium]
MRFTSKTKTYDIDLSQPEDKRWIHVMTCEKSQMKKMFREAKREADNDLAMLPDAAVKLLKTYVSRSYKSAGGRYVGEVEALADFLGESRKDLLALQCSFELTQFCLAFPYAHPAASKTLDTIIALRGTAISAWNSVFGCTSGICRHPELGMLHYRTLDWDLDQIGASTRIFRFHKGERMFVVIGILGLVGALSGMLPGAYSVSINYAPAAKDPGFDFGPLFLLREVLEECDSYGEAVSCLKTTRLSSNVFFTVCGAGRNEGCIIERTRNSYAIREFEGAPVVQGNHFHTRKFTEHNEPFEDSGFIDDSVEREEKLASKLAKLRKADDMKSVFRLADVSPVRNEDTRQKMIFCPKAGDFLLSRLA